MGISVVYLIVNTFNWTAFGFGILLNAVMIRLIARHTPVPMRIYSKGIQNRQWNLLAFVCWVFFVYVSMFGYVSQFIYRYLALVRNNSLSTMKYFMLFLLMLLFPLAYCVNLFICTYPPADHALMDDASVALILGINLTIDQIVLARYSFHDSRQTLAMYYIIIVCTIAYIIIFVFAFVIQRFMKNISKTCESSAVKQKLLEMNKQVSRNLIIQASMPLIVYLSLLFLVTIFLLKIDTSRWEWLQYYNLMSTITMFLPSALNPIVSFYIIKSYRRVIVSAIPDFGKCFKLLIDRERATTSVQVMQQH